MTKFIDKTKFIIKKLLSFNLTYWLILIPILYLATYIPVVHAIPNDDYWAHFFVPVFDKDNIFISLSGLFSRGNEHMIFTSNIVYLINFLITHGDNRGLFVFNILINIAALIVLVSFFKYQRIFEGKNLYVAALITSIMLFSPNMSHNWIRAMSGIPWFLANTFFIISLMYVFKYVNNKRKSFSLIILIVFSILSVTSYSTGLITLIVISIYLLFSKRWVNTPSKDIFIYLSFTLSFYLFWIFFWYSKPPNHPALTFNILERIDFILVFLGNGLSYNYEIARIYGIVGILLFALLIVFLFYKLIFDSKNKIIPQTFFFFSISLYAFMNTLITMIARSGREDLIYALQDRYVNISNLFWLGIALAFLYLFINNNFKMHTQKNILINFLLFVFVLFILIPSYKQGIYGVEFLVKSYIVEEKSLQLGYELGVYDKDSFKVFINIDKFDYEESFDSFKGGSYTAFDTIINAKLAKYHYPFNVKLLDSYKYGENLDTGSLVDTAAYASLIMGSVDNIQQLKRNVGNVEDIPLSSDKPKDYKITGWVCMKGNLVKEILVIDMFNKMVGGGLSFQERLDVKASLGDECKNSGFVVYVKQPKLNRKYKILIKDSNNIIYNFKEIELSQAKQKIFKE